MNNLNIVLNALEQLSSKFGDNYRCKNYYADMRNRLNNVEHCHYYDSDVDYIYKVEFTDSTPVIVIGLNNRKEFIFPNVFTHKGITYKVEIVRPVSY